MSSFIGIDLGTTFCAVSALDDTGRPKIIHNPDGKNITPSCLEFFEDGKIEIGEAPKKTLGINTNVVGRFKREMGTSKTYEILGKTYTPKTLSSILLKKLFNDTKKALGDIEDTVVTIPANFSNEARNETMQAAESAGLNVDYIINEPTAAALYYAFHTGSELNGHYAVFDLGGGTFDISIVKVTGQEIDVVRSNGISKLGGDDFDKALQSLVIEKVRNELNHDINGEYDYALCDAEDDKISLSKRDKVLINLRTIRKNISVTKVEFEEAISGLLIQAQMACEAVLSEANLKVNDIKSVFLVGGSTRMPCVRSLVSNIFKQEPISSVNVDEVVALGASLYAAYKGDQSKLNPMQKTSIASIEVGESTAKYFGTTVMTPGPTGEYKKLNDIIIKKGEKIPCSLSKSYYTISDNQQAVACDVTESSTVETDPNFVKTIWEGDLPLPPNRPAGQEIRVTFGYDENQIMKCSFQDVETKKIRDVDINMTKDESGDMIDIEEIIVE